MIIYRIQHNDGRGPFRPGFSHVWSDEVFQNPRSALPTITQEFGSDIFIREGKRGEHYGTGVRTAKDICRWFSNSERMRLALLGFNFVSLDIDRILGESKNQILFARLKPLRQDATIIPWNSLYMEAA